MSEAADNYKKKMASGLKLLRDTPPTINTTDNGPEGMMGRAKAKLSRSLVGPARKSLILNQLDCIAELQETAELFVGLREYVADLERKLGAAVETLEAARRECGRMHGYRNMEESISYILTLCDAALNDITGEGVR